MTDKTPHFRLTLHRTARYCKLHHYRDDLPCPWPNCQQGTEADVIRGVLRSGSVVFTRRPWIALDGSERFTWDDEKSSCYLRASRAIQAEFERFLPDPGVPELVYHYTTVDGLFGILSSDDLWLTDHEFLNDATELRHGLAILGAGIDSAMEKTQDSRRGELLAAWKGQLEQDPQYRLYLACFSLDGDSLSQWRGYGSSSSAVAIGFEVQSSLFFGLGSAIFDNVTYDEAMQQRMIASALQVYLEFAHLDHSKPALSEYDPFRWGAFDSLLRYVFFLKHPSFAAEREVRLVYAEDASASRKPQERAQQSFRSHRGKLIPYTTARAIESRKQPTSAVGRLPIREIVIGPQESPDLLALGIARLLRDRGYDEVTIRRSRIPYRPPT